MGKMFAKHGLFVCALVLALGFLPLYGCGGSDTEEFSCEFTRSITSGGMSMSVTYDCPDEASCNACTGDDGDCSGCRKISPSPEDMGMPGDGDGTPPGSMPDSNDDVECAVGLELMAGESCSFDDGQNRFTINNTGDSCCLGTGICSGSININNVVVMRNAEGDCVVESLP